MVTISNAKPGDLDDPDCMATRLTSSADDTRGATPGGDVELEEELPVETEAEVTKSEGRGENGVQKIKYEEEGNSSVSTPTLNGVCRDRKGNEKSDLQIDPAAPAESNGVKGNRSGKSGESRNEPKETAFDWLVLLCSFGSNVIFGMDFNSFSVFYPELVEYFGATTAQVGWCLSIAAFVGSVLCKSILCANQYVNQLITRCNIDDGADLLQQLNFNNHLMRYTVRFQSIGYKVLYLHT